MVIDESVVRSLASSWRRVRVLYESPIWASTWARPRHSRSLSVQIGAFSLRNAYWRYKNRNVGGPTWSAPTRADSRSSSMRAASELRKLRVVMPGTPSPLRTLRHCVLKLLGSRSVRTGAVVASNAVRQRQVPDGRFLR